AARTALGACARLDIVLRFPLRERRIVGHVVGHHEFVVTLDQKPLRFAALHARAHQRPAAAQTRAVQFETQMAVVDLLRGGAFGAPRTFVPDRNRAGAVMAFRNRALERTVAQRMVFDFHREALDGRVTRRALWYSPTTQHAADLE